MSVDVEGLLHEHQLKALRKMHNGCILAGDVGSGKTHTALGYALSKEPGRHIYVITTAKKRDSWDWEETAASLAVPVDGITVDSWNNISKYVAIENAMFIFDEQRLVGTGAWVQSFYKIAKHNRWILLSATPGDNWLDYVPVFIANGFYKNITEFRERHVLYARYSKFPKVQRYLDEGILIRRRALLLVEMPMERHTTRHIHHIYADYDVDLFEKVWKKRWHVYEERPILDAGELFRVGRKVVNTDPSRLNAVRELMEKHDRLIVFYNFDYELELLRTLGKSLEPCPTPASTDPLKGTIWEPGWSPEIERSSNEKRLLPSPPSTSKTVTAPANLESGSVLTLSRPLEPTDVSASDAKHGEQTFAIAEWNGHKHEPIPETDRWIYLVQYTSGSEGWNCISTDAVIFYSLTYSYKQFYQCQGRIDRMNTPFTDLHYYVLMTKSIVDKAVWRALSMKKDFNVGAWRK